MTRPKWGGYHDTLQMLAKTGGDHDKAIIMENTVEVGQYQEEITTKLR